MSWVDQLAPWKPPRLQKALQANAAHHSHHESFAVLRTKPSDMNEFGVGTTLYFEWLRQMTAFFVVLTLASAPAMLLYAHGDGLKAQKDATFELTFAGNLGQELYTNTSHPLRVDVGLVGMSVEKSRALEMISFIDVGCCCLWVLVCLWMVKQITTIQEEVDDKTTTISDYSVQVTNPPADVTENELEEYFEEYGDVVDTVLGLEDAQLIKTANQRSACIEEVEKVVAKMQKVKGKGGKRGMDVLLKQLTVLRRKVKMLGAHVKELQKKRGKIQNKCVCAFVTFKEEDAYLACLAAHPDSVAKKILSKGRRRFLQKHYLNVTRAPEPSDILYENLQYGLGERRVRQALTAVVMLLCLVLSFAIVTVAASAKGTLTREAVDLAACPAACLGAEPDLADAACKECFCTQALRDKQIMENKDACQDYFLNFIVSIVAEYLPSVAIVTSNIVLKVIVRRTAQYEHHHSLSGEQTSKACKLFLAQLLNMGVSPLIANARLPGAAALVEGTPVEGYVLSGGFDDLTAKWYTDVGRSLVITIALTSVTRPLLVYLKFWKAWLTKKRAPAALTQRVMNKMLEGPDFELAERYGEVMNLIFVAFLYSTAMPLVYALLALSLGLQYLMEKYELLKLCKKPPAYTADLALMTANTLPYALLGHFLLGIWALSSFPDKQSSLVAGFATYWGMAKDLWLEHVGVTRKRLFERVMQRNAALLTLLLLAFLVFLVLKAILGTLVRVLLLIFRGTGDEAEGNASFDAVVRSRLLTGAASYSILVNPKYSAALATDNVDSVASLLHGKSKKKKGGKKAAVKSSESQNEEIPVTPLGDRDPDDAASYLTDDRDADDRSARSALSSRSLLDRDGATPRSQARSGLASGDGLASRLELDDLSPRTSAGGFGTPRSQSNLGTPRSALSGRSGRSGRSASILPY